MKIRLTNSLTTELIDKANPAKNRYKTRPIFDLINFFSSKESGYIYLTAVRLVYDDYRIMQTNTSDVICAYINKITLQLRYRISRDRFTVEYPLADVQENARLIRVGMTKGLRLQFKMSLI